MNIKIMNLISNDLTQILFNIHKIVSEIDSSRICEALKYITFWLYLLCKVNSDAIEYNYNSD
jgi:hypothetical protein